MTKYQFWTILYSLNFWGMVIVNSILRMSDKNLILTDIIIAITFLAACYNMFLANKGVSK